MRIVLKTIKIFLLVLLLIVVTSRAIVPIYDHAAPTPFSGSELHNPYAGIDSTEFAREFKKANLHAHESNAGAPFESMHSYAEGEFSKLYRDAGYDYALISDHQHINPASPIPVYEHGMNLSNFHINVFGAQSVWWFDIPFTLSSTSVMQWKINRLRDDGELLSINHPHSLRAGSSAEDLSLLTGYDLIEVFVHNNHAWDSVLSAGRYIMLCSTDDSHYPDSDNYPFQNRYTMVAAQSPTELLGALKSGLSYGVQHIAHNTRVGAMESPRLKRVEMSGDTLFVEAVQSVDSINYIGQGGVIKAKNSDFYVFESEDTYIRAEIFLSDGKVIILNPIARISALTPLPEAQINWLMTILNSLLKLAIVLVIIILTVKPSRRRRPKKRRFKYRNRALNI